MNPKCPRDRIHNTYSLTNALNKLEPLVTGKHFSLVQCNTLAYWAHSKVQNKVKCCEYSPWWLVYPYFFYRFPTNREPDPTGGHPIKCFSSSLILQTDKIRLFVPGKPFKPCLTFVEPTPKVEHHSGRLGRLKRLVRDQHCSLFVKGVSDEENKFWNIDPDVIMLDLQMTRLCRPGTNIIKLFTAVIYDWALAKHSNLI